MVAVRSITMPPMEDIILQILDRLRAGEHVDDRALVRLIHAEARREGADKRSLAKRRLLPFYQRVKREEPARWQSWGVTPELERELLQALRMKPRRTASGVATITVITKPWPCSGDCLFCPNDLRMPKSYLHAEPACARAEQNCFDPYLQVSARLTALSQMGHATDKIELIILGGTWSDYPESYQVWFVSELFRALNDSAIAKTSANPMLAEGGRAAREDAERLLAATDDETLPPAVRERRALYRELGIADTAEGLAERVAPYQDMMNISDGAAPGAYNRCVHVLYGPATPWGRAAQFQTATFEELERQQRINEQARHRVVGLVIETRPDAITPAALTTIRRLGATKIQMGIQSLDQGILDANERRITVGQIERAFTLVRLFGFKIHAHMMLNLLGATPEADKLDYESCVRGRAFQPDEIKLYPCALIEGTRLGAKYRDGSWRPYTEDELLDVLAADIVATPAFCRISRMIRDFSSDDIMVGNKKPNLRQLVELRLREREEGSVQEIRYREISTGGADLSQLTLETVEYQTAAADERFLQWVTPVGKIAGFLRLSLPDQSYVAERADELPIAAGEAMIREVHVYGMAAQVGEAGDAAQHHGLGRALVERACELAREAGYARINVISAVGTREYYRHLGFTDHGLYQQREL